VRSRYSTVSISSKTNLKDDAEKLPKSAAMAVGLAEKDFVVLQVYREIRSGP